MAETYCGKSCAQCQYKEAMNCPGCRVGPGRQYSGDCELAKCARNKGYEGCTGCEQRSHCGYHRDCHRFPEYRRKKQEAQAQQQEALAKRRPVLGKGLWILFWLFIPSTIAGLITGGIFDNVSSGMYDLAEIVGILCPAVYGFILLQMGEMEGEYRTAGIFTLVYAGLGLLLTVIPVTLNNLIWLLLLTIPSLAVEGIAEYREYGAHSTALADFDRELSGKWSVLQKWFLGMYLGVAVGMLLVMMAAGEFGAIVMLAASIGLFVVNIVKLVYLYNASKVFR